MSGQVTDFKVLNSPDEFEIFVDFIESDFFRNELTEGNLFTINEASKILGKGKVKL